jgi:DnaJ-class molecular chaperone
MSTCSACNGYGTIECPECEGTGQIIKSQMVGFWTSKCMKCNESGEINCPNCDASLGTTGNKPHFFTKKFYMQPASC